MASKDFAFMEARIRRRIAVKSIVFGFWAVCMIAIMVQEGADAAGGIFATMTATVIAVWAVTTVRDARRLRNDTYLQQAAIAESDERNIQIAYRATRIAAVAVGCLAPIAICLFAYFGMMEAVNTISGTICVFLVVYIASWAYVNRTC